MTEAVRISVKEARGKMLSPNPPLLVCAYDDDKKFRMFNLEGAVPFSEFARRLPTLSKDQGIIFY